MYLVNLNQIWIVNILFRQIYHQTKFRLVLNQTEKCNCNLNVLIEQYSNWSSSVRSVGIGADQYEHVFLRAAVFAYVKNICCACIVDEKS